MGHGGLLCDPQPSGLGNHVDRQENAAADDGIVQVIRSGYLERGHPQGRSTRACNASTDRTVAADACASQTRQQQDKDQEPFNISTGRKDAGAASEGEPNGGNYLITPTAAGYSFNPEWRLV